MKKFKPLPKKIRGSFESRVGATSHKLPTEIVDEFKSSLSHLTQEDEPLGPIEPYFAAACRSIGAPYHLDDEKIYHYIGDLEILDSISALDALVSIYLMQRKPHNHIFGFELYLDACKRIGQIERQIEAVNNHEEREMERAQQAQYQDGHADYYGRSGPDMPPQVDIDFLNSYSLVEYKPNASGFFAYLSSVAPDLAQLVYFTLPLYIEEDPNRPHGYILGTPGSGKSELLKLLVHTYVTNEKYGSVVVIDPTSDFITQIAKWKEFNTSDRLIYIRPTLAKGMTPVLNPFEIQGVEATDYSEEALNTKRVVAQELVEALGRIVSETGNHLTPQMATILTNCVLVLLDKDHTTLEDLARFMKGDQELARFASGLSHNSYLSEYFQEENAGFNTPGNRQTKEAVARRLDQLLSIGTFKRLTCGKSTVNLTKAVSQRKVVLFDLGKGSIGRQEGAAFGRLVIAMLLGMAYRRENQPKKDRVPCSLVVDECHNFVTESMSDILSEARKYRLFVTLAQQTAGQKMPHELKDAVLQSTNFQAVGGTTPAGARRNAELVGVDPADITALNIGEFYVRPQRSLPAVKFKTRTDLLDWKNSVAKETWGRTINDQIQRYYRHFDGGKKIIIEEEPDISPQEW